MQRLWQAKHLPFVAEMVGTETAGAELSWRQNGGGAEKASSRYHGPLPLDNHHILADQVELLVEPERCWSGWIDQVNYNSYNVLRTGVATLPVN